MVKKKPGEVTLYGLSEFLKFLRHIPSEMVDAVNEVNGRSMTLEELVNQLEPVAEGLGGTVVVVEEHNLVLFTYGTNGDSHCCTLLRYK
jgi:hypothetical protein